MNPSRQLDSAVSCGGLWHYLVALEIAAALFLIYIFRRSSFPTKRRDIMIWILNNRGLIFAVILIIVPLVITGWFFGTTKNKKFQKNENKESHVTS